MFILFLFSLLLSQHHCAEVYNISSSQPLAQGQTLVSPGHIFELGFFSPNNSTNKYVGIWHKTIFPRKVVWVANREKALSVTDTLASLTINSNGNLELVDGKQSSIWSTNISVPSNGSAALLFDSGNFVVQDDIGAQLWRSFDYPGDTLLPMMLLGFDNKFGKRDVLTAWKSESDASTGLFSVGLAPQIPTQMVIRINGSTPYWRSGLWDKATFLGIPGMNDEYLSGLNLDDNVQQGTKYFSFFFNRILAYMEISYKGTLKLMYSEHGENWNLDWEAQKNPCDHYGICGPFGVCKASESPICKCLKGFKPKSQEEWSKGNRARGCVRKTKLFCRSNTSQSVPSRGKQDGFLKMSSVNLPDFHEYISRYSAEDISNLGAEECKVKCIGERKQIKLMVSLIAVCFISILAGIVFSLHRLRSNQKRNVKVTPKDSEMADTIETSRDALLHEYIRKHDPSELVIYDFDSISIATSDFSITNKLGEGGFGPVYRGKLQEGKEIAVKRLSSSSVQGIEEFKNEMRLISKLQHKNLVRLMGCCIKDDEKLLIYEFMPNKSLDTLLFSPMRRAELDWAKRFNIIQGVARGLLYLHHDSCLKVIHRDLKVSNILLDEKMSPKISDFGLARIFEGTQNLANTQKVVGTLGYMSPEYAMGGIFSEKSDIYSFGVLLLEIIGGRKNTSFYYHDQELGLIAYAWHSWNEGRGLDLVDDVLADSYSPSEVMRCVHIGLLCVQDDAADRPTMPDVVFMLSRETDRPQPKRPIFTFRSSVSDPQPQYNNICSANEDTITLLQGR
ncbi:G-type lectin S-receptor-like serine/threonine-protein kinase SD1-29 isoform X2 [Prunus avium]|uniref:Receptor-like serine/threonine-protein kinase n=1 Tax=Prunus avium TaxID=42229 RepID=A0A6P5S6C4_PRUAV|nr:G-type lectin S-receptor-like serine/threonine-protein kinase SD1-29 isoform X2 [Prunus avium]